MTIQKKARVLLTAVAAIGIVGGTMAVKAKSAYRGSTIYCTNALGQPGTQLDNFVITNNPLAPQSFCTTTVDGVVAQTRITPQI